MSDGTYIEVGHSTSSATAAGGGEDRYDPDEDDGGDEEEDGGELDPLGFNEYIEEEPPGVQESDSEN